MKHELKNAILKVQSQRIGSMKYIPVCFNNKTVKGFMADLIIEYGYQHFDDLTIADKSEFAAVLIEASGRDAEYECLVESDNMDSIMARIKAVLQSKSDSSDQLIQTLKETIINYYHGTMEAIFWDVLEDYDSARREWLDFAANNGDEDQAHEQFINSL